MTSELAATGTGVGGPQGSGEREEKNTYSVVPYNGKGRREAVSRCTSSAAERSDLSPRPLGGGRVAQFLGIGSRSRTPSAPAEAAIAFRAGRRLHALSHAAGAARTAYFATTIFAENKLHGLKNRFWITNSSTKTGCWTSPPTTSRPLPQSWATETTKPADASPRCRPTASGLHVAGVPTPGQDEPPPPPYPTGGSSGRPANLPGRLLVCRRAGGAAAAMAFCQGGQAGCWIWTWRGKRRGTSLFWNGRRRGRLGSRRSLRPFPS